jgi:AcrR family transcriptional regulator
MTRQAPYNRDQALEAALTLFWRKGYHGTSLKDLEAALNMKPGSIYAAFKSKSDLFRASLDQHAALNLSLLSRCVADAPTPYLGVVDFIRQLGNLAERPTGLRACMAMKTVLEITDTDPELRAAALEQLDKVETYLTAVFEDARATGELPETVEPARLAARVQIYILGFKVNATRGGGNDSLRAVADDLADELLRLRRADA